jgi:hypothetical protein
MYPRCMNPKVVGHDRVTGKINEEWCKDVRDLDGKCGSEGQHWEGKRSIFARLGEKSRDVAKKLDERYGT